MKKLNNKGFAISTALYGLLIMMIILLALILQILKVGYDNNTSASKSIQTELNKCREERQEYYTCVGDETGLDCSAKKTSYNNCINP